MQVAPQLNEHGLLPPGIHDLSLDQIEGLFGTFQESERRLHLFKRLRDLVDEIGAFAFSRHLIVDGSFITAKAEPSDIDLIFAVAPGTVPLTRLINPFEYNALSSKRPDTHL